MSVEEKCGCREADTGNSTVCLLQEGRNNGAAVICAEH